MENLRQYVMQFQETKFQKIQTNGVPEKTLNLEGTAQ